MPEQPFIKFYGTDWRSDPKLRMCSAAARGVWIDCITLMMEADPYGHLVINGRPASVEQIAAFTVTPSGVVRRALNELEQNGVFSRDEKGTIYSRRMVKDNERRILGKQFGKQGGNPALRGAGNPPDKPTGITETLNPQPYQEGIREGVILNGKPESIARDSEPKGSGAKAPDAVKALFDFGRSILTEAGSTDKQARSLVGRWRSELQDDAKLMALLVTAKNKHAQEPVAYIEAAIKREVSRGKFGGGYVPMHPGAGG